MMSRSHIPASVLLFVVTTLELEFATASVRAAWQHLRSYDVQLPLFGGIFLPWWAHWSKLPWEALVVTLFLLSGWIAFSWRRESRDVVAVHAFLFLIGTAILLFIMIVIVLPFASCC
jgi:hypothetical protein